MNFSPRTKYIIEQIKANLKFFVVGLLILALLAFGFVVAMSLLFIVIITVPILRIWQSHKAKGFRKQEHDIDDFIDVEYEIVETKRKKK